MGWSLGNDNGRDVGYGVPATCDHPKCNADIDRGLAYICANEELGGGEHGCGLFFCYAHRIGRHGTCSRCNKKRSPYPPKPDHPTWVRWKLEDESWQEWRDQNPDEVAKMKATLEGNEP
jgi:hypothetical protein